MRLLPHLLLSLSTLIAHSTSSQHPLLPPQQQQQQTHLFPLSAPESELLSLHRSLVSIPSVSGNEAAISSFLADYLRRKGYTVETQIVHDPTDQESCDDQDLNSSSLSSSKNRKGTRTNILAYPSASYRNTKIILTSHIDTVPPFIPYSITPIHNTSTSTDIAATDYLIHGRGTNDAKGSVAAQILALDSLLSNTSSSSSPTSPSSPSSSNPQVHPSDTSLLFVLGEETHGRGMKAANSLSLSPRAVIFGEPTENKLANGHKGILGFDVIATGVAAHSGYPWLGESAVEALVPVISALRELEGRLPSSERYGNSTLNIGRVVGGEARNVVPAHAKLEAVVRLGGVGREGVEGVMGMIREAVESVERDLGTEGGKGKLEVIFPGSNRYEPVRCDTDIEGFEVVTVNYGADVPNLKGEFKRYLYGPGSILTAHSAREVVRFSDLVKAVEGYKRLVWGVKGNLEKEERGEEE